MRPLTVAISNRVLSRHTGGNSIYAWRLYEHLDPLGVRAIPLTPPLARRKRTRQGAYALAEAALMPRLGRARAADLLHFPADTGPLVRSKRLPTVVTLHGVGALHEPGIRSARAERVWLTRARRAALAADQLITCSEHSRTDILRLLDGRSAPPIEVIPHGIDAARFRPATDDEIATARQAHGLAERFLLYVGNIEPRKNLPALVAAVDQLNANGEQLTLYVVGKPAWDAQESLEAIERSPHVARLGFLPDRDVRALMSACAAFVFPSRYEGFGLPVLEAMSCGAPVVCTRRGSLEEVSGGVATHAEAPTPDALVDAIRRALAGDRAAAAAAGREHAARYTWAGSAERHRVLFDRVAAAR